MRILAVRSGDLPPYAVTEIRSPRLRIIRQSEIPSRSAMQKSVENRRTEDELQPNCILGHVFYGG